jgi:site-specific DNA-cytosine methylase
VSKAHGVLEILQFRPIFVVFEQVEGIKKGNNVTTREEIREYLIKSPLNYSSSLPTGQIFSEVCAFVLR